MKTKKEINSFTGEYRFLSNFWPCKILIYNTEFASVEHAYQAAKTMNEKEKEYIKNAPTAGEAKRRARKITLREDWEKIKLILMWELLRKKFSHPVLANLLLETEDAVLIEGNTWGDKFWGICDGEGKNYLGIMLMKIREELKEKRKNENYNCWKPLD